jgi:hypothetical protein
MDKATFGALFTSFCAWVGNFWRQLSAPVYVDVFYHEIYPMDMGKKIEK